VQAVRRWEPVAIVTIVLLLTLPQIIVYGAPRDLGEALGEVSLVGGGLALLLWRRSALWTVLIGGGLFLVAAALVPIDPDLGVLLCTALAAVAGYGFSGRAAWTSASGFAAWLAAMYLITGERDIGLAMLTIPGFLAGTAVRLRRQTADELAIRGRELEEERELFAELAVRNERARIAAELHDIIGHSLSVMVVQAAAGQRLVQQDPAAGQEVLGVIAESARQGRADLHRLVELLGGQEVAGPDLSLIDEMVARAARSGLQVTCRFEGDRDGVPAPLAGVAFRVVREALTNALRHAPGAPVSVLLRGEGRSLEVRVDNEASTTAAPGIIGTGQGLRGLRDRVEELGGRFSAGATNEGGWAVEALLRTPA
jgi:signal transduction histidine kinase